MSRNHATLAAVFRIPLPLLVHWLEQDGKRLSATSGLHVFHLVVHMANNWFLVSKSWTSTCTLFVVPKLVLMTISSSLLSRLATNDLGLCECQDENSRD